MKRLLFILGALCATPALAQRPAQPNFVLILADDLGWQDLKCYDTEAPFSVFETPYIDALAIEGVLFRQAYSPAPVCAPSRSGILSGKHPARLDNTSVIGGECPKPNSINSRMMDPYYSARLELEEITIPEELAPHGYFSGHMGKWHMAVSHNSFPNALDQGFDWSRANRGVTVAMPDRTTGFATTNAGDPYQLQDITGQPSTNGFAYDQLTQDALEFLNEATTIHSNAPFFCYYASWLVHTPIHMRTERLLRKYAALMDYPYPLTGSEFFAQGQNNPYYAAMVETFDYHVHRIVTYLKETDDPRWPGHKLIENTYVFLTSDNGGMENAGEWITDNYPLDRGKIRAEEGGTRVPFIVLGPDIPTNVTSEVMINGLDLYPTMLALAGLPIPDRLEGSDLSNLLLNDPQDATLVTNAMGQVRGTMYWHFPHGSALHSTIRKDGWKLFKNFDHVDNAALEPYRLYQLYDTNGVRVDIEEAVDLAAVETNRVAQLAAELEAWFTEVNASVPHYNPKTGATLANKDQAPAVLDAGHSNNVAWVTWETNKAAVGTVELIYTLNGDNSVDEEWFDLPVTFMPGSGYADVTIPDGTTHYVFNLIDSNNFLVSSVDVGADNTNTGKDSTRVPRLIREPNSEATITNAGTTFPTTDVVIGNAVGESDGLPVRDDATAVQAGGQSFTVTTPTTITALTLQSSLTRTIGTGTRELVLWIGNYSNGMPSVASADTRVFEWIDVSDRTFTNLHYYTIDFTDAVLPPGTYAFQLAWRTNGADHWTRWRRADGGGTHTGGSRLFKTLTTGPIHLPYQPSLEQPDNDMVFALHGVTTNYYGDWAEEYGLPQLGDPAKNTLEVSAISRLERDHVGFRRGNLSAWTVSHGVLANSSTSNDTVGEGALGRMADLSAFTNLTSSQLTLSFDYTTADPAETLFVHLWGYVDVSSVSNTTTMNLGAQNGNAWESSAGTMTAYNLGKADGVFNGTPGIGTDAAAILTGSTGLQTYSNTFDLSGYITAPDTVAGYDYLTLGFAREVGGASTPAVSIRNIVLSVEGGNVLLEFLEELPADDLNADPDADLLINLLEYGLGGDPTNAMDIGILPFGKVGPGGEFQYVHRRRVDATLRGLTYTPQATSNLTAGLWSTNGVLEVGSAVIDAEFEQVTNHVGPGDPVFGRLKIELAE